MQIPKNTLLAILKKNPIKLRLLDKSLHYKLLIYPDLYFGEAYADGSIKIENGTFPSTHAHDPFGGGMVHTHWSGGEPDVTPMGP